MATDDTPPARCSEQPLDSQLTMSVPQSSPCCVDAHVTASPLLGTPLEIGNIIYRLLLTTSYALVWEDPGKPTAPKFIPYYQFQPALLHVNKEISEGAEKILCEENVLVDFRMKIGDRHQKSLSNYLASCVPHIKGLSLRSLSPRLSAHV